MSNCAKQIKKLEDAIAELPKDSPTRSLWEWAAYLLGDMCNVMESVHKAVRGDGNGEKGLLARMNAIEGSTKAMRSDMRYMLTLLMISMGYEHDPEEALKRVRDEHPDIPRASLVRFTKQDNPQRRVEDQNKLPPVVVEIIKAIIIFVFGGIFLWLATEILPRIFSIPPP